MTELARWQQINEAHLTAGLGWLRARLTALAGESAGEGRVGNSPAERNSALRRTRSRAGRGPGRHAGCRRGRLGGRRYAPRARHPERAAGAVALRGPGAAAVRGDGAGHAPGRAVRPCPGRPRQAASHLRAGAGRAGGTGLGGARARSAAALLAADRDPPAWGAAAHRQRPARRRAHGPLPEGIEHPRRAPRDAADTHGRPRAHAPAIAARRC